MLHNQTDAELIILARDGSTDAFAELYDGHAGAARNLARQLAPYCPADRDDFVSEAFERIFTQLRCGAGPDSAFRAYLLTALRRIAYEKTRRDRRLELAADITGVTGADQAALCVPFRDPAVAELDRSMAARAFATLPERWQSVLRHTAIEGRTHAQVAEVFGLTANGTAALAYRAREGLRQAFLQAHLDASSAERCRPTVDKLGAWTRDGLGKRDGAQIKAHLDRCTQCTRRAEQLAEVDAHQLPRAS